MKHLENTDLAALFHIEMADDAAPDTTPAADLICGKCHGKGKFIGWSGRSIGPCFACDGTGLARSAGVVLAPGDCAKCMGSGEWRPGRPCFACNGTGREIEAASVDVSAIVVAFAAAREKGIKTPRLRLDTFVFSRAPDSGRNAGAIYVKTGDEYLGKIADGKFRPTLACDDGARGRVIAAAADPHKAAVAYGRRTGSCGCCGRELTNGESIDLGIGPICRGKFGW